MAVETDLRPLQQFVDDELLRAPLLFDQMVEGTFDLVRQKQLAMPQLRRSLFNEMLKSLQAQRSRLSEYFVRSLRQQVSVDRALQPRRPPHYRVKAELPERAVTLALVDEDVVALDIELSHMIEEIKSAAEYEMRELQTFTSALIGDMDVARDYNPFRPETYARALWAAAQALPLSHGHQVTFMRLAGTPLAQLLRKSYAAASSRLESMGVEPAAYRTLILPGGSRRGGRPGETTFSPDLQRLRDSMPAPLDSALSLQAQQASSAKSAPNSNRVHDSERASVISSRVERQSIELVGRLFEAMLADERVPGDVGMLISRLQGPAMRLTLRDGSVLDQDDHPLWRLINRLVFEAEMVPDPHDPERRLLLKLARGTVDQLASEPEQDTSLYRWACERLDTYLQKRLTRGLAAVSSQIGALQKLEDKLHGDTPPPSTLHGMLDVPQLDTVPAELMEQSLRPATRPAGEQDWLSQLRPGDWVRMFLQGRWVQARLLWPGERREIWLFGDGGSDKTWAVRRGALVMMHRERLAKKLRMRAIVATAAARVREQNTHSSAAD